jgi:hypothetical protein
MQYLKIIQEKINKLLKKKYFNDIDKYLFEIYVHIYLILKKKRNIAQVFIDLKYNKKIIKFLDKYYPYYKLYYKKKIILYDKNYNINNLNETFTKKFGLQLGNFYKCSGNLDKIYKKHKILLRPVIYVNYSNTIGFELFAQMCPPLKCLKNLNFFKKITNKFSKTLKIINKNINVILDIQIYNKT